MSLTFLEIDGSHGEGGGQILRTSLTLSLLTGKPFHLFNVRAGRPKPGLQPQHLMSVRAAATVGQAETRGAALQSQELFFQPGPTRPGAYQFDIGTAGATGLVLHTLYLPLMLHQTQPSEITLIGGTHVQTSPTYTFLETTWRRYMEQLGLHVGLKILRPGFYPRGGGQVVAHLQPTTRIRGFRLRERGAFRIRGFSAVAGLPDHIARRQARRAVFLLEKAGLEATLREEVWQGGPGSVLALILEGEDRAVPTTFVGLGARGKPAETVAEEAVAEALSYVHAAPAAVDSHSGDQLLLPLALAEGPAEYTVAEVTRHQLTNADIIRRFLERKIQIEGVEGEPGTVRIE